ncbi:MAG: type secretion system baseplate subunit TssG, partial [Pseudomonadota bacterium]
DRHGHVVRAMDRIRFRHDPDLKFSTSDVVQAEWNPDDALGLGGVEITTSFLGLTGTVTPLPLYFTEEIVQDDSDAPVRRELLDVFHNRLLRTFATAYLGLDYGKSFDAAGADRISTWARGLLAYPGGEEASEQTTSWLRYAPAFVQGGNTADGLLAVLRSAVAGYLGLAEVTLDCFAGGMADVADDQRTRLGQTSYLGRSLMLGSMARSTASRVRAVVGELSAAQLPHFLPDGVAFKLLKQAFCEFVSSPVDADLELVMRPGTGQTLVLGGGRLGVTSFLGRPAKQTRMVVPLYTPSWA